MTIKLTYFLYSISTLLVILVSKQYINEIYQLQQYIKFHQSISKTDLLIFDIISLFTGVYFMIAMHYLNNNEQINDSKTNPLSISDNLIHENEELTIQIVTLKEKIDDMNDLILSKDHQKNDQINTIDQVNQDLHKLKNDYNITINVNKDLKNKIDEMKQDINKYEEKIIELSNKNKLNETKNISSSNDILNELDKTKKDLDYQISMNKILASIIEQKYKAEEINVNKDESTTDSGEDVGNANPDLQQEIKNLKEINSQLNREIRNSQLNNQLLETKLKGIKTN